MSEKIKGHYNLCTGRLCFVCDSKQLFPSTMKAHAEQFDNNMVHDSCVYLIDSMCGSL